MTSGLVGRYADFVATRSSLVIGVVLLLTALVGAGIAVGEMESRDLGEFDIDGEETRASEFIDVSYPTDERILSQIVVRDDGGNVLTRESLLESLRLQQSATEDNRVGPTLDTPGFVGLENIVAVAVHTELAAERGEPPETQPTLADQIDALEAVDKYEAVHFDRVLERVLDGEIPVRSGEDPLQFLPSTEELFDRETLTADARLTLVFQTDDSSADGDPVAAYNAQLVISDLVEERFADGFVFGQGINDDASAQATGDSFAIITPVAFVIVLFVLGVAYRDVLDILLAFAGIVAVMVWLGGIMGWLQMPMNVILIAVPFLLVGLSIDYALHVIMRYREARTGRLDTSKRVAKGTGIRQAMALGLGSVVLALAAATFSTGVGFLSNIVSPLPAIRDFAVLSAGGILATFFVFGALVPALKVELDGLIENRLGRSRTKPAFGVGRGVTNSLLSGIAALASRSPVIVIVVALVLATGGAYGATTIDTEFNQADFLPEDPPAWTSYLPGPLQPGSYTIADDFAYLSENFGLQGPDDRTQILIREEVTDGSVLPAIDNATRTTEGTSILTRPDGTVVVQGPHTLLRSAAADNETLATAIDQRDRTGNGLPDEDVGAVYDLLFEIDQQAASNVLSRSDGDITSARLLVSVKSDESAQQIAIDSRALATAIQNDVTLASGSTTTISVVATGGPVTEAVFQDALLENLVEAFSITLVVILVFLTLLFWRLYRSLSLGAIVLAPVVAALAWLLGAMALLGIPFNSETAVITSLAIGLGVDYSIHAGERFITERERHDSLEETLEVSITGTGGALLASAGTTAAGFGVLALALSPPLQRFGIVTGSAIVLAFVASVTVLPCLLVVRERIGNRIRG